MRYMLTHNYLCDAESYEYLVVEAPRDDTDAAFARAYEEGFGEWISPEEYATLSDYDKDIYQYIRPVGMFVNAEDVWLEPAPPNTALGRTDDPFTARRLRFSGDRKRRHRR